MDQREAPLYEADYLQLNQLLSSQSLMSVEHGRPAHNEMFASMVHRMIGNKIGTGGSSGHSYLKATTEEHKIFTKLSTFLILLSRLPDLPEEVKQNLDFHYSRKK
jgi:tryptophan 2,3-dioxygenase